MEELLQNLNEMQRKVVQDTEGAVLLIAGAGSGKTRVLTHRIAYILEKKLAFPSQILAITFTNKAANEMRERLERMIEGNVRDMWVCTIHSMCVRILRMYIERLGYIKSFSIYSESDKDRVLKRLIAEMKLEGENVLKDVKWHISNAKNNNYTPDQYIREFGVRVREYAVVFQRYEDELRRCNALDFDDLLVRAYQLLSQYADVREALQEKFRYIHIDEFQDTNTIQYELVKLLAGKSGNIFAVGDDDQSIYGFRGAVVENVFHYQKDFPNVKVYKLEQNYRSTKNILDAANKVIKVNKTRMQKQLWTENGEGSRLTFQIAYDEAQEANYVVSQIYSLKEQYGYKYSDFAVLMRVNALSRSFEQECLKYNIPSRVYGGFKFFERKEVKDLIAYLRLLCNPFDEESLLRIVNVPKRGIGEGAVAALRDYSRSQDQTLFDSILTIEQNTSLPKAMLAKFTEFKDVMMDLLTNSQLMPLEEFADYFVSRTGMKEMFGSGSDEDENKLLNIDGFVDSIKTFAEENEGAELSDFIESVTLMTDLDGEEESDSVVLATIHGVKGLEFKVVFLVGLELGIFPISRSKDNPSEIEEERRLMYVAITRARERLYLTHAQSRYMYGQRTPAAESPFFAELCDVPRPTGGYGYGSEYSSYGRGAGGYGRYSESYSRRSYGAESGENYGGYSARKKTSSESLAFGNTKPVQKPKAEQKDVSEFVPGAKVEHAKFGEGTVIRVDNQGVSCYVDVAFKGIGVKTFSLQFAPLKVLH